MGEREQTKMAGEDKRKQQDGGGNAEPDGAAPPAKRRRWDAEAPATGGSVALPPSGAGAPQGNGVKPALPKLDALAKAKAVLQKQKELAAKLKNVPKLHAAAGSAAGSAAAAAAAKAGNAAVQTASAAAAKAGAAGMPQVAQLLQQQAVQRALEIAGQIKASAAAGKATGAAPKFTPGALRLNEKGEEVDEEGNVVKHKFVEVSTFKANVKQRKLEAFAALEKEVAAEAAAGGGDDEAWMDPRMGKAAKTRKARAGFQVGSRFISAVSSQCPPPFSQTTSVSFLFSLCIFSKPCGRHFGIDVGTTKCNMDSAFYKA